MGQKHFESKWNIEQYLKELGLPHTILRPAAFMNNFQWNRAEISNGVLRSWGIRHDKRTQLIAVEDIGAIAAIVFSNRPEYVGRTLEIAGDELTEAEEAETLLRVVGRHVEVAQPEKKEEAEELLAAIRFFNGEAYSADIADVRRFHPGLRSFEQYLREAGWADLPSSPVPQLGHSRELDLGRRVRILSRTSTGTQARSF